MADDLHSEQMWESVPPPETAPWSAESEILFNSEYCLLGNNEAADVESNPTTPSVNPPDPHSFMTGRLFTATDAVIDPSYKMHPNILLSHDALPSTYQEIFNKFPVYLSKQVNLLNYLQYHSRAGKLNEKKEKRLLKRLVIPLPRDEVGKALWQCAGVGCTQRGTQQHIIEHLRTKKHIGLAIFVCDACDTFFHHKQDRDRHVRDTCKGSVEENPPRPEGSTRSRRGAHEQPVQKPEMKSRARQQLVKEMERPTLAQSYTQTHQAILAPHGTHHDPRRISVESQDAPDTSSVGIAQQHLQSTLASGLHTCDMYMPPTFSAPTQRLQVPPHQTSASAYAHFPTTLLPSNFAHGHCTPSAPQLVMSVNIGGVHASNVTHNWNLGIQDSARPNSVTGPSHTQPYYAPFPTTEPSLRQPSTSHISNYGGSRFDESPFRPSDRLEQVQAPYTPQHHSLRRSRYHNCNENGAFQMTSQQGPSATTSEFGNPYGYPPAHQGHPSQ